MCLPPWRVHLKKPKQTNTGSKAGRMCDYKEQKNSLPSNLFQFLLVSWEKLESQEGVGQEKAKKMNEKIN